MNREHEKRSRETKKKLTLNSSRCRWLCKIVGCALLNSCRRAFRTMDTQYSIYRRSYVSAYRKRENKNMLIFLSFFSPFVRSHLCFARRTQQKITKKIILIPLTHTATSPSYAEKFVKSHLCRTKNMILLFSLSFRPQKSTFTFPKKKIIIFHLASIIGGTAVGRVFVTRTHTHRNTWNVRTLSNARKFLSRKMKISVQSTFAIDLCRCSLSIVIWSFVAAEKSFERINEWWHLDVKQFHWNSEQRIFFSCYLFFVRFFCLCRNSYSYPNVWLIALGSVVADDSNALIISLKEKEIKCASGFCQNNFNFVRCCSRETEWIRGISLCRRRSERTRARNDVVIVVIVVVVFVRAQNVVFPVRFVYFKLDSRLVAVNTPRVRIANTHLRRKSSQILLFLEKKQIYIYIYIHIYLFLSNLLVLPIAIADWAI